MYMHLTPSSVRARRAITNSHEASPEPHLSSPNMPGTAWPFAGAGRVEVSCGGAGLSLLPRGDKAKGWVAAPRVLQALAQRLSREALALQIYFLAFSQPRNENTLEGERLIVKSSSPLP